MLDRTQRLTRPRVSLSGARAAYVGPALDLAPHRNAAATVAVALTAPFQLEFLQGAQAGEPRPNHIAVIPPNTLHHLRATGDMAFIYLDALSDDWACLRHSDLAQAQARLRQLPVPLLAQTDVDGWCELLGIGARAAVDPRMVDAARMLDTRPQDFTKVAQLAAQVGLSVWRFQTLFRLATGMPFRRYRLWRRMAFVVRAVDQGQSLTAAALDAGFASSAHLSTRFKALFGLSPSSLVALGVALEWKPSAPRGIRAASAAATPAPRPAAGTPAPPRPR